LRLFLARASWPTWLGLACVCCLLTLAALVVAGATRSLDVSLLARLRPDDVWGAAQVRDSPWMGRLEPRRATPRTGDRPIGERSALQGVSLHCGR
jgi:hypothetical protein